MIKSTALLSPIFASLFWGIVFLTYNSHIKNKAKRYLGFFMLIAFTLYCTHAVFFLKLYKTYSYVDSLYLLSTLSIYPFYYIYVREVINAPLRLKDQFLHLLPAVLFGLVSMVATLFLTDLQKISYVKETLIEKNLKGLHFNSLVGIKGIIYFLGRVMLLLQIVYYAYRTILRVDEHNNRVVNYYSNVEGKTLNWAKNLNYVIVFVAIASITSMLIGRSFFAKNEFTLLVPSLIFTSLLFIVGLKGNQQIQLQDDIGAKNIAEIDLEEISTNHSELLKKQLIKLFEDKKVYKHSDLRITTISDQLKTNRTYISRLINDEFGVNFNEFVNQYRVNEAKKLIKEDSDGLFTLGHIAEKSGFGSVNSFSRVFKETEGITPGKYRANTFQTTKV